MPPLVSIVLCAWNPREDWLREAVASALGQQRCEIELILVDDGSTTPVSELLKNVSDPRLRFVRTEHCGLAHARNAGTRVAQGDFVRFADADDVLEAGSTSRLLDLAKDGSIAYGATLICDEELRPIGEKRSQLDGWIAEDCLLYRFDVRHMSMLFPRPILDAVGEWDTSLCQCQDWDLVLRALEHAPVRGEQAVATYYRRHGQAQSANLARALEHESLVVDRYFERHPGLAGTRLEREARANLLIVHARTARALGRGRREQLHLVARAFALHPRRTLEELTRRVIGSSG